MLKEIFKKMWVGVRPTKTLFILSLILVILARIISIFTPLFYKKFFDLLGLETERIARVHELFMVLIMIVGLQLIGWVLWRSAMFIYTVMQSRVMANLRLNSFSYLIKHSQTFFANNFTGSLVQRVNRFARAFEGITDNMVFQILPLIILIIGSVIVTYFVAPLVSLSILIWVTVFTVFSLKYSRWKLKYDTAVSEADSRTTGVLSDNITNSSAITAFTATDFEIKNFAEVVLDQARKTLKSWRLGDIVDATQAFLIILVEFAIFYSILQYWSLGLATIGTFVLAQTYVIGLANQLWGLNKTIRNIYQSLADSKEMVEILITPYEIKDSPTARTLEVSKGEITFENVTFNFNETREVLSNLSLKISPGEKIALIGPSGAGKTTFVRLIMRLYDLTKGEIKIDGQNIQRVTQKSLRENISLVPQDPVLFHRSLLENIRYGRRDATDDEVKEAGRLAYCDEFIKDLPLGYATFVGERGVKLSGGERQRVAIARAILKRAPILILDEATSSLDSHSEVLIQSALDNLMKNCTTIVIAHRLSTIRKMDRIIAMQNGRVVEEGTHAELANKSGGLYKKLWDLQAGGFVGGE